MKNMLEIKGIKCDAEGCNYRDDTVNVDDYSEYLNTPCPVCGANLLTQEDFDTVARLFEMVDVLKGMGLSGKKVKDSKKVKLNMNGTGNVDFEIIDK